jgi:hypothetical protein
MFWETESVSILSINEDLLDPLQNVKPPSLDKPCKYNYTQENMQ